MKHQPMDQINTFSVSVPVHPAGPVCFSSWPVVVSVPPAGYPVSSALNPAAPVTTAPPTPPAHVSKRGNITLRMERSNQIT